MEDLVPVEVLAIVAAVGLLAIAAFQAALALGAPLGRAAWGGGQVRLPSQLRVASTAAMVTWVVAALLVLGRAGFDLVPLPAGVAGMAIWILVALLALGAVMNFASSSPWERFMWAPIALVLAVLCAWIALIT